MKRLVFALLLSSLLLAACGGGGALPEARGQASVPVKWDYAIDAQTGRFLALGALGDPGVGVPGNTEVPIARPADWPFASFCLDSFHLGAKQPADTIASYLVIQRRSGNAQPAISVRSDAGTVHLERFCFLAGEFPVLFVINNWTANQVMTFVLAGERR